MYQNLVDLHTFKLFAYIFCQEAFCTFQNAQYQSLRRGTLTKLFDYLLEIRQKPILLKVDNKM